MITDHVIKTLMFPVNDESQDKDCEPQDNVDLEEMRRRRDALLSGEDPGISWNDLNNELKELYDDKD